jgi:hypothetical protein
VTVFNQSGTNITANIGTSGSNGVPAEDPTGHWEGEETLDVEWAHAIAPGAKIDIIEVNDDASWPANLLAGDALAASLPGVSAISNSWGLTEWSGETAYDASTFVTPSGHTGVTFLTASNDNGANVYPSPPASPPPSVGNGDRLRGRFYRAPHRAATNDKDTGHRFRSVAAAAAGAAARGCFV